MATGIDDIYRHMKKQGVTMPEPDEIEVALLNPETIKAHERSFEKTGVYDQAYIDRVALLLQIKILELQLHEYQAYD